MAIIEKMHEKTEILQKMHERKVWTKEDFDEKAERAVKEIEKI